MKIRWVLIIVLGLVATFLGGPTSSASTLNFSVQQQLPDNQRSSNNFFDLLVGAGQEQDLHVLLTNDTKENIDVQVAVHTATTGSNGTVNYGSSKAKLSDTLPAKMEELLTPEQEQITLEAESSKDFVLHLKMPDQSFSGILAGGVTFKEAPSKNSQTKKDADSSNLSIANAFAYTVGILLREEEKMIEPELGLGDIKAGQINYRNKILIELINETSTFINELAIEATVTEKEGKVKYSFSKADIQLAPDGIMLLPLPLDGHKLKAGQYTLTLNASSGVKKWQLSGDFQIAQKEAEVFNAQEVNIEETEESGVLLWLVIVLGVSVLSLLALFMANRVRNRKKNNSK